MNKYGTALRSLLTAPDEETATYWDWELFDAMEDFSHTELRAIVCYLAHKLRAIVQHGCDLPDEVKQWIGVVEEMNP